MDLENTRKEINQMDQKILELIVKRLGLAKKIGEYKRENNLMIRDKEREAEIIKDRSEKFRQLGFDDEEFVKRLFELIMKKSREVQ